MAKKTTQRCRSAAKQPKNDPHPVVVLTFTNQDLIARIATDGVRVVVQVIENLVEFTSLLKGIAYLEARGYRIETGELHQV